MKFKLDENFGVRTLRLFEEAGYEVDTVLGEGLGGSSDQSLYEVCRAQGRCLVTLDLDFADIIRFPPLGSQGIVVIRVPRNPSLLLLEQLVSQLLRALAATPVDGSLWIVEIGRIRIRQAET